MPRRRATTSSSARSIRTRPIRRPTPSAALGFSEVGHASIHGGAKSVRTSSGIWLHIRAAETLILRQVCAGPSIDGAAFRPAREAKMEPELQQQQVENFMAGFATPPLPTTTTEFITALAHYHRAEIARMAGWRDRIDRTTNWAITGVAAMLSLSLSSRLGASWRTSLRHAARHASPAHRGPTLPVLRRLQGRVRLIERNYFAQMFDPESELDRNWARTLGEDLRAPKFLMSLRAAMSRRLRRNISGCSRSCSLAWVREDYLAQAPGSRNARDFVTSLQEIVGNADFGSIPGWPSFAAGGRFLCLAHLRAALRTRGTDRRAVHGNVHV